MGSHLGRPTLLTVALSQGQTGIPKFCLLLQWPKHGIQSSIKCSLAVDAPVHPTWFMRHQTGTMDMGQGLCVLMHWPKYILFSLDKQSIKETVMKMKTLSTIVHISTLYTYISCPIVLL